MKTVRRYFSVLVCVLCVVCSPVAAAAGKSDGKSANDIRASWQATWGTASAVPSPFDGPVDAINNTTLRQIVRVSAPGTEVEAKRQAVNAWIRTAGAFAAVVDFDQVLRDADDVTVMAAHLTADGLHPNADGYRAMAGAAYRVLRKRGHHNRR